MSMKCFDRKVSKTSRGHAFSLVEMLIVVGLIGIMASLAMVMFANQRDVYERAQSRRIAQELTSEFVNALVSGVDFRVVGDKLGTLRKITAGEVALEGAFSGKRFGVNGLDEEALAKAAPYIRQHEDGIIMYEFQGVEAVEP
jgi:prepilin-type N-terminal cleavage/methylation domain-containing protein